MAHSPIQIEGESWDESRKLVQYELNRLAQNIHDLRSETSALVLRATEQRARDLERLDALLHANVTRVAVLEAKALLYAAIGGAIGVGVMNWILGKF